MQYNYCLYFFKGYLYIIENTMVHWGWGMAAGEQK